MLGRHSHSIRMSLGIGLHATQHANKAYPRHFCTRATSHVILNCGICTLWFCFTRCRCKQWPSHVRRRHDDFLNKSRLWVWLGRMMVGFQVGVAAAPTQQHCVYQCIIPGMWWPAATLVGPSCCLYARLSRVLSRLVPIPFRVGLCRGGVTHSTYSVSRSLQS